MRAAGLPFLVEVYLRQALAQGRARGTVSYRRVYLRQLVAWLERQGITRAREVTSRFLSDYLLHLQTRPVRFKHAAPRRRSGRTIAAQVSVLRSFFAWLAARREVLFDPAADLALRQGPAPLPKAVLTLREVRTLLAAPGHDTLGLRDRAILETFYSTGLRRAELWALDLYDLDVAGGIVRVRHGKGGKDRLVPVGEAALDALRRYLRQARPELVERAKEPAVFVASISHRRLSVKTLNFLVSKHAETAGLAQRVTPHVLRHTCATHLLRGGADIRHVQALLGHASVATTQIYTRVAIEDLVTVHRRHHPRGKLRMT
jgi:integrase/recombinase XerD